MNRHRTSLTTRGVLLVLIGVLTAGSILAIQPWTSAASEAASTERSANTPEVRNLARSLQLLDGEPQEKTAEQTFKNIKILKGLPDSQLYTVMNFMRASLGVSCAYCHVNLGGVDKWNWGSDEKRTKQTARRMIQMVFDINNSNKDVFGGAHVNCFTCHRGNVKPVWLPSLPVPAPEGGPAGLPSTPTVALPSPSEVVARYVQAIGGRQAIEKMKSRVMNGVVVRSDGTRVPNKIYVNGPKALLVATVGNTERLQGFNGTVGWIKTEDAVRNMTSAEQARAAFVTSFFDLEMKTVAENSKIIATENLNGAQAFVLERPFAAGQTERLYFDTQSRLLMRALLLTDTILTPIPEQVDFSDYRDVDGVKLPFSMRSSFVDPWIGSTRTFSEIKAVPVDDSKFEIPKKP